MTSDDMMDYTQLPTKHKNKLMTDSLNIVFAGTPEFAAIVLQALLNSPHHIQAVFTQPDRPAGRGKKLSASPVKTLALQHALDVEQPATLKTPESQQALQRYQPDVLVVVAYGLLLPQVVLDIPKYACINVHPSLLPRWRGAAPIQHAIWAGDRETGVGIMRMEAGLDSGPVLLQAQVPITQNTYAADLHDQLAQLGAELLLTTLQDLPTYLQQARIQDDSQATYAHKINKQDARIDWQQSAQQIDCQIHACNPIPVAHTLWQEQTVRVWRSQLLSQTTDATPGKIIAFSPQGVDVACGHSSVLRLTGLQFPGKKPADAASIFNGYQNLLSLDQQFS
jgi:methionyl-tRNA formyltransferase